MSHAPFSCCCCLCCWGSDVLKAGAGHPELLLSTRWVCTPEFGPTLPRRPTLGHRTMHTRRAAWFYLQGRQASGRDGGSQGQGKQHLSNAS